MLLYVNIIFNLSRHMYGTMIFMLKKIQIHQVKGSQMMEEKMQSVME